MTNMAADFREDTVPITQATWRYIVVAGVLFALAAVVVARMALLAFGPEGKLILQSENAYYLKPSPKPRGLIYDRSGHLLAGDREVYELDINLNEVAPTDIPRMAQEIAAVLSLDTKVLRKRLLEAKSEGVPSVMLSKEVTKSQKAALERRTDEWVYKDKNGKEVKPLSALNFVLTTARLYPEGDLASNVLGFVPPLAERGYGGVEQFYDALLRGGVEMQKHSYAPWVVFPTEGSQPASLYLTIDRNLQRAAEEEAAAAVQKTKAEFAVIIVADPYTGAILAMATSPHPPLGDYDKLMAYIKKWNAFNLAIEKPYEPGSVFKTITMAIALDIGAVKPDTEFDDTGVYTVSGARIYNWNRGAWGKQTMVGCLAYSLNTCLAWVAHEKIPQNTFYRYLNAFGFGDLTGIDLGGEAPGGAMTPTTRDSYGRPLWSPADQASQGFGQAIMVTPVQMVAAISAIANGGYLVTPHVLAYESMGGRRFAYHPEGRGQVLSPSTTATLRKMLTESLPVETKTALVPGYSVAGKTGTAEIALPDVGYSTNLTNASFAGWFPADKPRYVIYVWLSKPKTSPWASVVAAPVFAEMVKRTALIENVPPDDVRKRFEGVSQVTGKK